MSEKDRTRSEPRSALHIPGVKLGLLPVAFLFVLGAVYPLPAAAGDGPLRLMLVNMTPDPVSEDGRTCASRIRRRIRADTTRILAMGETAMREAVGSPDGDFMSWQPSSFTEELRDHDRNTYIDAFVLFDCRPEDRTFRSLIVPASEGVARLEVNDVTMNPAFYRWAAARMLAHAWVGFSP